MFSFGELYWPRSTEGYRVVETLPSTSRQYSLRASKTNRIQEGNQHNKYVQNVKITLLVSEMLFFFSNFSEKTKTASFQYE